MSGAFCGPGTGGAADVSPWASLGHPRLFGSSRHRPASCQTGTLLRHGALGTRDHCYSHCADEATRLGGMDPLSGVTRSVRPRLISCQLPQWVPPKECPYHLVNRADVHSRSHLPQPLARKICKQGSVPGNVAVSGGTSCSDVRWACPPGPGSTHLCTTPRPCLQTVESSEAADPKVRPAW